MWRILQQEQALRSSLLKCLLAKGLIMEISEGCIVTCYNDTDMKDILQFGDEYQVEKILDEDLITLVGVSEPVFVWRFIDYS
nr:MAG TPA: hypothetical protein [Bacteriophage sp.]